SRVDQAEVVKLWDRAFAEHDRQITDDARDVISVLRLSPDQTARAAIAAGLAAAASGGPITADHVRAGARSQSAGRLESLAERIEPRTTFADLVLPPRLLDQVGQVAERRRH